MGPTLPRGRRPGIIDHDVDLVDHIDGDMEAGSDHYTEPPIGPMNAASDAFEDKLMETPPPARVHSDDIDHLVAGLRLGRAPKFLLLAAVGIVTVMATIGVWSYQSVAVKTESLDRQLSVSRKVGSYERALLTYTLVVDRWSDGHASDAKLAGARARVEIHKRAITDRSEDDDRLFPFLVTVNNALGELDLYTSSDAPHPYSGRRQDLEESIDELSVAAQNLFTASERTNGRLVDSLLEELRVTQLWQWMMAATMALVALVLVVAMRLLLRRSVATARNALAAEHDRLVSAQQAAAALELRFQTLVDDVSDVVFRVDGDGRWQLLSRAWESLSGFSPSETIGRPFSETSHPDEREAVEAGIRRLLDGERSEQWAELNIVTANGDVRTVQVTARAVRDGDHGDVNVAGTISDVTDRVRARKLTVDQTRIMEMVAREAPLDAVVDEIVAMAERHTAPGTEVRIQLDATDGDPGDPALGGWQRRAICDQGSIGALGSLEWRTGGTPGDPSPADDAHRNAVLEIAIQLGRLAINRQRTADRMVHQATHDELTGLPNRILVGDRIETAIERARRSGRRFAVMFIDVDRFKVINDSLGHRAGDRLLTTLAERLSNTVRASDTVARFGGDEFVVLIESAVTEAEVPDLVQRMLDSASQPVEVASNTVKTSLSIGVAFGDGSSRADEVLKNADVAMYRAKQDGRAGYRIFDDEMEAWSSRRHEQSLALQGAIDRGEMELWYQPLVDLADGRILAYEAVTRWRRPESGLVPPDEFIMLIEDLGLMTQLGHWVLNKAVDQLALWTEERPDLVMSVNVSGRELVQPDFVQSVAAAIERAGVAPELVTLEMTEAVLIEDTEIVQRSVDGLRRLGVNLAIDDFGTGYSSLQYLRRLQVDVIKIDKAFVSTTGPALHDPAIVASILDLCETLGIVAVAEGVETVEQCNALLEMGIETGQGFLFGRPEPPELARPGTVTRRLA